MCGSDIFLAVLAVLFPPLAVWVKRGICSADSLINIALCFLGFLPGLLHAWWIIASYPDPTYDELAQQDPEGNGGTVTYYYVQQGGSQRGGAAPGPQRGYGTVGSAPSQQFPGLQQGGMVPGQLERRNEGPSAAPRGEAEVPPTYQEAIKGDHKVQRHD